MSDIVPPSPPKAPPEIVLAAAGKQWLAYRNKLSDLPAVYLIGVRGYRRDTMGKPGVNDCGIYDDAMFLVTPDSIRAENANTDPSRTGWNPGVNKPFAILQPGVWWFRRGPHKGRTPALRQCTDEEAAALGIPDDGEFLVERCFSPGNPRNYKEKGYFAINIHPGGVNGTSSWGCQTLPPARAASFLQAVWDALRAAKQDTIPYILLDGPLV